MTVVWAITDEVIKSTPGTTLFITIYYCKEIRGKEAPAVQ